MSSKRIVILVAVVALLSIRLGLTANEDQLPSGTEVVFVVPVGTVVSVSDALLVFYGPSQGTVSIPRNCDILFGGPAGNFGQLQSAVSVRPSSSSNGPIGDVIVTLVNRNADPAPIPAGTRLGFLEQLDTCGENAFQGYRGYVQ